VNSGEHFLGTGSIHEVAIAPARVDLADKVAVGVDETGEEGMPGQVDRGKLRGNRSGCDDGSNQTVLDDYRSALPHTTFGRVNEAVRN
jgi:hypothetical protein